MRTIIATVAFLLMVSASVSAQNTDQKSLGLGYIFAADGTHGMGLTSGFGGEYINKSGLGWSAEIAAAGFRTSANGNPNFIGVGSTDLTYHFFTKRPKATCHLWQAATPYSSARTPTRRGGTLPMA